MKITDTLLSMRDDGYREFHSRLMPTVDKENIIGIRVPELRRLAKEYVKDEEYTSFIDTLPHKYYEENNLHAFCISLEKDFEQAIYETERFLPYIDNWATCDMFMPQAFKKHREELLPSIYKWIKSDRPYTVRYAVGLLMSLFLDDYFKPEYAELVSGVRSEEYYVNMMTAWYFATALAKQYDCAVKYLEDKRLDLWVHNKAIQKACESRRIDGGTKEYLKSLKIKK